MNAHIFAESSNTTAEDAELSIREYYEGLFGVVEGLHAELEELADTHLHVLSEEYGVVDGSDTPLMIRENQAVPVGSNKMIQTAKKELLQASTDADIMVILLSADIFRATVSQQWEELVDKSKPHSIWCLGAARSVLDKLDFDKLESKGCTVLTYQRVGVARIGTQTREELLATVKEKSTE